MDDPRSGLLTIIWLIGFYAIILGIVLLAYLIQRHRTAAHPF